MKLTETQILEQLARLPHWQIEDGQLVRTFDFNSYSSGVAFALQVAMLSEKLDHHPDSLSITWKKVRVGYITHSAGGLTALDFEAAQKVNHL